MIQQAYKDQVSLLLEAIGPVFTDKRLGLKGGTAINLFILDMPRLSVDIDVVYLPVTGRDEFIQDIEDVFQGIIHRLKIYKTSLLRTKDNLPRQLIIENEKASVKIDVNLVVRGSVYDTKDLVLCKSAEEEFEKSVKVQCLSFEDIYAGKFCAALDRQHPRDIYDVHLFFQNFELTEKLKKAFIIYLLSGNRPIHEVLVPNLLDQKGVFEREFYGMTRKINFTYEDFERIRLSLVDRIKGSLTEQDKKFLIEFNQGNPRWDLLNVQNAEYLPGIKWKLLNIEKMPSLKRKSDTSELEKKLFS